MSVQDEPYIPTIYDQYMVNNPTAVLVENWLDEQIDAGRIEMQTLEYYVIGYMTKHLPQAPPAGDRMAYKRVSHKVAKLLLGLHKNGDFLYVGRTRALVASFMQRVYPR